MEASYESIVRQTPIRRRRWTRSAAEAMRITACRHCRVGTGYSNIFRVNCERADLLCAGGQISDFSSLHRSHLAPAFRGIRKEGPDGRTRRAAGLPVIPVNAGIQDHSGIRGHRFRVLNVTGPRFATG